MRTILAILVASIFLHSECSRSQETKMATVLKMPSTQAAATNAVHSWLRSSGMDCEIKGKIVVVTNKAKNRHVNILPLVSEKGPGRLLLSSYFVPKKEYVGSRELTDISDEINRSENFLRVFVEKDGNLGASSYITFVDEITSNEFNAFFILHVEVVEQFVLTGRAKRLLK